jgi:hypothetical protein
VAELNTLRLDLGVGYGFYLKHPNAFLVTPASQLSFDIFIINLHDRFLLQ